MENTQNEILKEQFIYFFRPKHRFCNGGTPLFLICAYYESDAWEMVLEKFKEAKNELYIDDIFKSKYDTGLGVFFTDGTV